MFIFCKSGHKYINRTQSKVSNHVVHILYASVNYIDPDHRYELLLGFHLTIYYQSTQHYIATLKVPGSFYTISKAKQTKSDKALECFRTSTHIVKINDFLCTVPLGIHKEVKPVEQGVTIYTNT